MRLVFLFLATWLTQGAEAPTEVDAQPPLAQSVERLVRQLGSPLRRDREEAEEKLISSGPETLGFLPSTSRDAAIASAVERIRSSLEQEAARRAGAPGTVTLQGANTLAKTVAEIERQTRNPIALQENSSASVTVDWDKTPFWQAVANLEQRANLELVRDRPGERLLLKPAGSRRPSSNTAISGPCRVLVESAIERPNLVDPTTNTIQVRWRLALEPRLRPLYAIVADRDCRLSNGTQQFGPLSIDARHEIPCDRWDGCELDVSFPVPRNLPLDRLTFSAAATVKVAALPLEMRFNELTETSPAPRRRGGASALMRNVRMDAATKTLSLELAVEYDRGGPEFESHRSWIYQNAAWLVQKSDGRKQCPAEVDLLGIAGTGGTLGYRFEGVDGGLGGFDFVYEAPSLVIDVPVKVEGVPVSVTQ